MKQKITLFFLFSFILSITVFAQQKDFEVWGGLKYKTVHTKRVATTISVQSRFHENASRFLNAFADFNVAYNLSKNIEASASYVFLQKNDLRYGLQTNHQYYAGISIERKISALDISYDFILQNNHKDFIQDDRQRIPRSFSKNKVKLEYKVNKTYSPYVYSDIRHRLFGEGITEANRLRIGIGLSYRLDANSRIDLFYLYQKYLATNIPRERYVIGAILKLSVF